MTKNKLSIIMPFAGEYPQNIFTVMSIYNQLIDTPIDWELIAVNNWCEQVAKQPDYIEKCPECNHSWKVTRADANSHRPPYKNPDPGGSRMQSYAAMHSWLKYLEYPDKLSHWSAKNAGVAASSGDILFFIDAHCALPPGALTEAYYYYIEHYESLNGTLHLPIAYFLERQHKKLIYKLVAKPEISMYHYTFTNLGAFIESWKKKNKKDNIPRTLRVPCMSTCGMLMTRELFDLLGGWPKALGIYGGGENFINFTLATMGKTINIYPGRPLHHYAEKRGYNWYYTDHKRNQIIATYLFGGPERARVFSRHCKLDRNTAEETVEEVIAKCQDHRAHIQQSQTQTIEEWYEQWAV